MPTYFALSYGAYSYVANIDTPASITEGQPARRRDAVASGVDGGFSAGGLLAIRRVKLKGMLAPIGGAATDAASFRGYWDNFKAVHAPGLAQWLCIDSDRGILAEVELISDSDWSQGLPNRPFEVGFVADDPYWYSVDPTGGLPPVPKYKNTAIALGATAVTTAGTAATVPLISIAVTAVTPGATITVANAAGQTSTIAPVAAGTFVIDSSIEDVTESGSSVIGIWTGEFLKLAAAGDVVTVSVTGAVTLGAMSIDAADRWY